MEHLKPTKKQLQENVQPVTESTRETEIISEEDSARGLVSEVTETEQTQEAPVQVALFDLSQFPKEKIAMAEELGIPISQIAETMNGWAASVEARFNVLAEALEKNPEKTIQLLQMEATKARNEYVKAHPQEQQQQGGGLGGIQQLLPLLGPLLGGGGNDQLTQTFMTAVMQNGLEAMSYGNALVKAIMTRIAPEMANEVTAKMLPPKVPP